MMIVFPDGMVCISVLHPNDDEDADPDERASERSFFFYFMKVLIFLL